MITGQIDLIIKTPHKTYLFDWKTSAKKHISWQLQGACYRYLCSVNGYINPQSLQFVKLNKGKKPTCYKFEDYEHDIETFKRCVELYHFFDMGNTRNKYD